MFASNKKDMWNPNIPFRPNFSSTQNIVWYHKRKLKDEIPSELLPPPKMLITEEKMVSQLKGIHLSKDYTSHGGGSRSLADESSTSVGLEENHSLPTLVVCDEIRALQKSVEPVLPKHIMDKYQRPTNALVIWQPPVGDLGKYLRAIAQESTGNTMPERPSQTQIVSGDVEMNEDDDNNNNNNAPPLDLNRYFTRTV